MEKGYKTVFSPTIRDTELPEPDNFNGLQYPYLDANSFYGGTGGGGPWGASSSASAFSVKVGAFTLNTSTGSQQVTGLGFTPKLVIFLSMPDTADVAIDAADFHEMIGAASASSQWVMYANSLNAAATSDTVNNFQTGKCIISFTPAGGSGAEDYAADLVTMNTDGFTLNVSNAPSSGYKVGYMALGGSDITAVKVGSFSWANSGGAHAVTGVGFQPTALLVCGGDSPDQVSLKANARFNLGLAVSPNQAMMYSHDDDALATINSGKNSLTTRLANQHMDAGSNAQTWTSMDADGWTYTTNTAPTTGRPAGYIAIKCLRAYLGNTNLPTSAGSHSVTGVGFQPKAGFFFSIAAPTTASADDDQFSFGFAESSTAQFVAGGFSDDGVADSVASHFSSSQNLFRATTAYPGAVEEEATFSAWGSDGFNLTVGTAVASNPAQLHYLVMG